MGVFKREAEVLLVGHGDCKYLASQRLSELAEWPDLRMERRRIETGQQSDITLEFLDQCAEMARGH
ncbi:hypothetical protein G6N74_22690 [Mesorhizobium sp. CGMCC 1.15528]|uniref:Uncharacterized protein n=1 Tax=Mesorhizobium zhangyense TaxID=1776730 RepID=A0A7C9RA95_9HYPH|nr:hypothetical protein [Mesorhizobium zhangyense]NGN43877.1 hypothetical protein [Mesorhizobium zhangyense]